MITFLISFLIGFGVLFGVLYSSLLGNQKQSELKQLEVISSMDQEHLQEIGEYLSQLDNRLTIVSSNGTVVYDNMVDNIEENHNERKEIKEAKSNGTGDTIRSSDTTGRMYLYVSYFPKGDYIYRLAISIDAISSIVVALICSFIVAFCIALFTVWFLSKRMADSILYPLGKISKTIRTTKFGTNSLSFENYTYPELIEITNSIQDMDNKIKENLNQLEKEKKVRQDFFANASHELKTPLTSIMGYSELLRTNTITDPNQRQKCLDNIHKEANHMSRLVNDILMVSKLESEDYKSQPTYVRLNESLQRVLDRLKVQAEKMNITFEIDCEDLLVYASKDHISTILENLISNAIKYNVYDGTVQISCFKKGKNALIKVSDTGIGISKKDQERVFQRFYRVDKQRSKVVSGTGLGLSIVKHLVQFYQGTIYLQSQEQKGTTITLSIPIAIQDN